MLVVGLNIMIRTIYLSKRYQQQYILIFEKNSDYLAFFIFFSKFFLFLPLVWCRSLFLRTFSATNLPYIKCNIGAATLHCLQQNLPLSLFAQVQRTSYRTKFPEQVDQWLASLSHYFLSFNRCSLFRLTHTFLLIILLSTAAIPEIYLLMIGNGLETMPRNYFLPLNHKLGNHHSNEMLVLLSPLQLMRFRLALHAFSTPNSHTPFLSLVMAQISFGFTFFQQLMLILNRTTPSSLLQQPTLPFSKISTLHFGSTKAKRQSP